jgi:hypothetical protein
MPIRFSECPEYLAAIPAKAAGNFELARANLEALIAKIDEMHEPEELAYVLYHLADVEGRAGNEERGLSLQARALAIDSANPLILLFCAKSLLGGFHRPDLALMRLQEAEAMLLSPKYVQCDNDLPYAWYELEISETRQKAMENKS